MTEKEMNEQNTRALERIGEVLDGVRDNVADLGSSTAVLAEQTKQINAHLSTLNGRMGRSEDRTSALEANNARLDALDLLVTASKKEIATLTTLVSELRGAWKLASAASGVIGFAASWVFEHWGSK